MDLNELNTFLADKEKHLQLINSLLVLQDNKDYKKVFNNYLFKDRIIELSYKLKFSTEEGNKVILKELEAVSELKLLIEKLSKEARSTEEAIRDTKQLITEYMTNNENED